MEPIAELTLHSLDGERYHEYRRFIEARGGKWGDSRSKQGQLLQVHLTFPPGTTYRELDSSDEKYKRHQIIFRDSALMYWSQERATGKNRIGVPAMFCEIHQYGEPSVYRKET